MRARSVLLIGSYIAAEIFLYFSYGAHDARFHWFTHFFIGAVAALIGMSIYVYRHRKTPPLPLLWPLFGHLFAMTPDFLFNAGIAHYPWMDIFLLHITSHFIPGRNLTWYLIFLLSLGIYLMSVCRFTAIRIKASK